jgi:hypothetical protein
LEDPKFRDYQSSLNLLLSQPEILKKMSNPQRRSEDVASYREGYVQKMKKEVNIFF